MEESGANNEFIYCPVCGLKQPEPLFDAVGNPSWATCHCCGFMAGHTDDSVEGIKLLRNHWLNIEGAKWFHREKTPTNWCVNEQLKQIPQRFL